MDYCGCCGDRASEEPRGEHDECCRQLHDVSATCANGCPDGYLGRHKFSCRLAGRFFLGGEHAVILGENDDGLVCAETAQGHVHVRAACLARERYPDVRVQLTGRNGNIFVLIGAVSAALRRTGHDPAPFAADITNASSYGEALRKAGEWVKIS